MRKNYSDLIIVLMIHHCRYPFGDSGPQGHKKFAEEFGVKLATTWQEFFALHSKDMAKLKEVFDELAGSSGTLSTEGIFTMMTKFYDGRRPTQVDLNYALPTDCCLAILVAIFFL